MTSKYRGGRATLAGRALERETLVRADYQAILRRVAEIPAGKVATYTQIAWLAGLPGRARLVGRVLGEPHGLDVPWHRVINAQGKLSLPINSEPYLEQRRRLREEGVLFKGERIDLRRYQWRSLDESPLLD